MTDEARIQRLTELARQVWPDASVPVDVEMSGVGARVSIDDPRAAHPVPVAFVCHTRALDALEAALFVLAGKTPLVATRQGAQCVLAQPAWVEQLASEWEAGADAGLVPDREAQWLRLCAADLRKRAKGEPWT